MLELRSGPKRADVVSGGAEVETGARAMLLLAPGLFRLDVRSLEDTVALVVRNLSDAELRMQNDSGYGKLPLVQRVASDDPRVPTCFELGIEIDAEPPLLVEVVATALSQPERGTTRFVAQAIVRPAAGQD